MLVEIIILILVNFFLFKKIKFIGKKLNLVDSPDGNLKFHKNTSFTVGGLIFLINISIILVLSYFENKSFFNIENELIFYGIFTLIFLVGFLDDKNNLSPNLKLILLTFLISFCLLIEPGNKINSLYFSSIDLNISVENYSFFFTLLCYLLFLNAVNMFDGINLQLGLYVFTGLIYLFVFNQNFQFLYLFIFIFFFLICNFDGKIFMGDNGSLSLAFFFSYLFINNYNLGNFNGVEQIFIYMAIPGIDMFRLFIVRLIYKKNPFKGDNNHLHHLLSKSYGEKKAAIYIFLLIFFSICLSFLNFFLSLFSIIIIYSCILFFTKKVINDF